MKNFLSINWRVRAKNPLFWAQVFASVVLPVLAYFGLKAEDVNTWGILLDTLKKAISNPFVLGTMLTSIWGVINDPTTSGLSDSSKALSYKRPNDR